MDEAEYHRRIQEIEAYYTERVYDKNWQTRMYYPQALAVMSFMLEVIESEYYGIPHDIPPHPWMAKHLDYWQAHWSKDGRP